MHLTVVQYVALAIGLIELVIRVIPTVGMFAPIGIILKVLNAISDFLNNTKK